ncbi:TIGR03086 family metal-binding protein [Streptomyces sp. NPDC059578]|uniref:TIGR03086 family metal-binding protein n=1 Tax=unclassified Streptomyces TaxID=2593676 RepID=UPI003659C776
MESSIRDLYGRIADRFGDLIENCPPEKWDQPSPCPGWTARDVAAHVVSNHRRAVAGLDGSAYSAPGRDDDLLLAWGAASAAVRAGLRDRSTAGVLLGEEFGGIPFAEFVKRMACADTLVHTWDLARATGQGETLDAEGVSIALAVLLPEDDDIRLPGAFGTKVPSTADADPQTRLLNFLGRRP